MILQEPIAEHPISSVSISSPYMLFKFFEGTGTDVVAETNIAGATTTWLITGGGGVTWSTKALAITPDTTTATYITDPDYDPADDADESPLESLLRTDDTFGTMFIAFTMEASATGGPSVTEYYISMGDNTLPGFPLISVSEDLNANIKLIVDDGTTADQAQVPVASYTETDANTFLFALNKTTGNIQAFVNGKSSAEDTTTITADLSLIIPPEAASRPSALFTRIATAAIGTNTINDNLGRVASIDNMLIVKSQTELTAARLQLICDGLKDYKGDKPWSLDNV